MNKICTTIEQSKKLIELGVDVNTADMHYNDLVYDFYDGYEHTGKYTVKLGAPQTICGELDIPAWSLPNLLNILPPGKVLVHDKDSGNYKCICNNDDTCYYNNLLDAVFEMVCWLLENKEI